MDKPIENYPGGELRSSQGETVQYIGTVRGQNLDHQGIYLNLMGRASLDFGRPGDKQRLIEDTPASLPVVTERRRGDGDDFELVDAAGVVRYKGSYLPENREYRFSPDYRRFVYISRRGQLTVVDLRTFKAEELGKDGPWRFSDRLIMAKGNFSQPFGASGRRKTPPTKLAIDVNTGHLCESEGSHVYCFVTAASEPPLDAWYRPVKRFLPIKMKNLLFFDLLDGDGAVRFSGSFWRRNDAGWFTPNGRWFVFVGGDPDGPANTTVVDLVSFKARVVADQKGDRVPYRRLSTGGRYYASREGVFELETGTKVEVALEAVISSPDDQWAVVPTPSGQMLYSFSAATTTVVLSSQGYNPLFSPSGRYVFLNQIDAAVYEVPSGRLVARVGPSRHPNFSPNERYLAVVRPEEKSHCRLELLDLRHAVTASIKFERNCNSDLEDMRFTGDGNWLAFTDGLYFRGWRLRRGPIQRSIIAQLLDRETALAERLRDGRAAESAKSRAAYAVKIQALRPAKGEFESGAEYAARMKAADEQEALIKREGEGESERIAASWDLKARHEGGPVRESVESALDEEVTDTSSVTLRGYDADDQEFAATFAIDGAERAVSVGVSRKDAPAAKARVMQAALVFRHRLENGKPVREDLRLTVRDPELGEVYSWSSTAGTARRSRSAPAAPARLDLKAEFSDPDGDGRLTSGETAKLTVTVANSGSGAAYGVSASLEPSSVDGLSFAARHFIGEVPSGGSRTVTIPVKGLAGVGDASRALTVSVADANGFTSDPFRVVFETRARRGARLVLAEFKVTEAGGDGIVTPGELVEVLLRLRNDGAGAAEAADIKLSGQGSDLFVQGEARRALGALAHGQTAEVRYTVFANTSLAGDRMRFTAVLSDGGDSWEAPVEIPLRRALGATRELVVKGRSKSAAAPEEEVEKPAAHGAARPDAYAVILGAEDYPKAARVSHARRDAAAFRQFAVGVLGVPDDAAHLFYLDDGVTLAELRKAFSPNGWLARRVGSESDVYIFYAGHGAPSLDGKGAYLVPQDGDPNYAVETGFLVDDMLQALNGSKARSATVWLDACFSGADRENRPLLADARPLMLKADIRVPDGKVALFSAASGSQVSSAFPEKRHGLFTWFSMRGLDGEADADKNGSLTTGELADFLGKNVSRAAGSLDREQTPGFRGDRARVLATYRR